VLSVADLHIDPSLQQVTFSKPEDAANAFASFVKKVDQTLFDKLLGEDFREILPLDDISSVDMDNFNNASSFRKNSDSPPGLAHRRFRHGSP
jgi:hypothetical protein